MRKIVWLSLLWLLLSGCGLQEENLSAPPPPMPTPTPTLPIGVTLVTRAPPTAVVVQTTPTPFPSATPTPSPTPLTYVVAEGDTLLDIALARGYTLADIEAVNPGLNPDFLQIGQLLALPPPPTPLAQAAVGTPVPIQVRVAQINGYRTPVESLWLLGVVVNEGDLPVENVRVEIGLQNAAGETLITAQAWAATAVILPGASAPFGALLPEAPATAVQPFVAAIIGGGTVTDLGSRYLELAVLDTAVAPDGERVQISGQVVNEGGETAVQILLSAALYDGEGRIVGFQQAALEGPLAPAARAPFSLGAAPPGGAAIRAVVTAQGLRAAE